MKIKVVYNYKGLVALVQNDLSDKGLHLFSDVSEIIAHHYEGTVSVLELEVVFKEPKGEVSET